MAPVTREHTTDWQRAPGWKTCTKDGLYDGTTAHPPSPLITVCKDPALQLEFEVRGRASGRVAACCLRSCCPACCPACLPPDRILTFAPAAACPPCPPLPSLRSTQELIDELRPTMEVMWEHPFTTRWERERFANEFLFKPTLTLLRRRRLRTPRWMEPGPEQDRILAMGFAPDGSRIRDCLVPTCERGVWGGALGLRCAVLCVAVAVLCWHRMAASSSPLCMMLTALPCPACPTFPHPQTCPAPALMSSLARRRWCWPTCRSWWAPSW